MEGRRRTDQRTFTRRQQIASMLGVGGAIAATAVSNIPAEPFIRAAAVLEDALTAGINTAGAAGAAAAKEMLPIAPESPLGRAVAINENGDPIVTPDGRFLLNEKPQVVELTFQPFPSPSNPANRLFSIREDIPSQGSNPYPLPVTPNNLRARFGVTVIGNLTDATAGSEKKFVSINNELNGPFARWFLFTDSNGTPVDPTTNKVRNDEAGVPKKYFIYERQVASVKPLQRTMDQQFHGK